MYKLLIVDDETIEREGMVNLIPWEAYGICVAGSAWNGLEGYEMVKDLSPDIVLTDIKMPVLNGIEFIRKVQEDYKDIVFVVLSGYGEFEFTSQAMQMGVKYYILKPCDEEKIIEVMNKVTEEIAEKKKHRKYENDKYEKDMKKLLPKAKEQFFQTILMSEVESLADYEFLKSMYGKEKEVVFLLHLRIYGTLGFLEKFVLLNILEELLGFDQVLLSTSIKNDVLLLIPYLEDTYLKQTIIKMKKEYLKFDKSPIGAAISDQGDFSDIKAMYRQTQNLLMLGEYEDCHTLLSSELNFDLREKDTLLMDYDHLKRAKDFPEILFEVNILFAKFHIHQYSIEEMRRFGSLMLQVLLKEDVSVIRKEMECLHTSKLLYEYLVGSIEKNRNHEKMVTKEERRMKQILTAIYGNINHRYLSQKWLAKEVLFINEDYLGRVFIRAAKKKFSVFIFHVRMEMALRILQYKPDILISELAELVGYTADGQYFSKAFKKYVGKTPSEYRELLADKKNNQ